jgi:RNA methyltransferase, TrmH family
VSILTKAQIKHIQSFAHKKYRDEHNCFVAEGLKICSDIIANQAQVVLCYCTKSFGMPNECIIEPHMMQKISMLTTPTDLLIVFKKNAIKSVDYSNKITLVLDGIQDPGNLGTIIRTAHWYGIQHIVCSLDTADAFSSKVVQASMGSIIKVNIIRCALEDFLMQNNAIETFSTTLQGESLKTISIIKQAFIVIGKEGEGVRPAIQALCKKAIKIQGNSNAESLNVAVATGIICQHFLG